MIATMPTQAVARELMRRPADARWAREISIAIKAHEGYPISRGTVGRILSQMEQEGWLTSWWESRSEAIDRPTRRYYRILEVGELYSFLHPGPIATVR